MGRVAVIVAGGTGLRMGSDLPKQFLPLNGLPVLMHAIGAFDQERVRILLVIHPDYKNYWQSLCQRHAFNVKHDTIDGGSTRFHSVYNAMAHLTDQYPVALHRDIVIAIHDGVRPLVSPILIERIFTEASQRGNAVPSIPLKESIRKLTEGGSQTINRSEYRTVQTPQGFQFVQIRNAYQKITAPHFFDDASVVEASGIAINLIEGEQQNIKITYPDDFLLAESILNSRRSLPHNLH